MGDTVDHSLLLLADMLTNTLRVCAKYEEQLRQLQYDDRHIADSIKIIHGVLSRKLEEAHSNVLLVRMEKGKTFKASYLMQFKYFWYDCILEAYVLSNKSLADLAFEKTLPINLIQGYINVPPQFCMLHKSFSPL